MINQHHAPPISSFIFSLFALWVILFFDLLIVSEASVLQWHMKELEASSVERELVLAAARVVDDGGVRFADDVRLRLALRRVVRVGVRRLVCRLGGAEVVQRRRDVVRREKRAVLGDGVDAGALDSPRPRGRRRIDDS